MKEESVNKENNPEKDKDNGLGQGPKYTVNIDGKDFPWPKDTITYEELLELGNITAADGIIEIDLKDQTEKKLNPGDIIDINPGKGFAKKVKFKRGLI